ncbi:magnesium and cobalt transport protein CorA [Propionivibrio dicarboxylicus]|uniref:Magnesium transporter n=1 Tax=Propionivibrio dicarboxylicus TaxID=83767 RepID=A0A1G7X0F6_9RHOO|nr:magnesium and cobalt transport protein CorA [Propionivibrio dicarboxylicus]SDG77678.1 magnesium transporter [Propionivibrio dicarboxylicus]
MSEEKSIPENLDTVKELLAKRKLVEELVHRSDSPRHDSGDDPAHKQHPIGLHALLERLPLNEVAAIIEALEPQERLQVWNDVREERGEAILEILSDEIREDLICDSHLRNEKTSVTAFELRNGRLSQINVNTPYDLRCLKPIWVDLVAPTPEIRAWVGRFFDVQLPNPNNLKDLEASARFYVEDNGEIHLHSDFLLDLETESRNVAVAFIQHKDVLFSVRTEELPTFRLQRLRARTQPGYVSDGKDVLLDLYAADAEYSADALEDIYADLEAAGKKVLNKHLSDEEAAAILSEIARSEDLNGRIRRNVLDTRRAVSFLMRGKFLTADQQEDARQILRDIESLDGHTSFLFNKINFLMDATVGFININQNQRVSKLTTISVIFMPINILAGIGGMSEFSMMTQGVPWPLAYAAFIIGMMGVGWATFLVLRHYERRMALEQRSKDALG